MTNMLILIINININNIKIIIEKHFLTRLYHANIENKNERKKCVIQINKSQSNQTLIEIFCIMTYCFHLYVKLRCFL